MDEILTEELTKREIEVIRYLCANITVSVHITSISLIRLSFRVCVSFVSFVSEKISICGKY
jgi:hypothetical protein